MTYHVISESVVESAALAWLESTDWRIFDGADIASERADYGEVVLEGRLRDALGRLNPDLPVTALDDAFRKLAHPEGATLETRNRSFHRMLIEGVTVEYGTSDGCDSRFSSTCC